MIELTKDQIFILGRPNFACAAIAKLLIKSGLYAEKGKKAEYEQAVYIHWASDLFDNYGSDWGVEANKIIDVLCKQLKEKT